MDHVPRGSQRDLSDLVPRGWTPQAYLERLEYLLSVCNDAHRSDLLDEQAAVLRQAMHWVSALERNQEIGAEAEASKVPKSSGG